jgi:hypothetical protein
MSKDQSPRSKVTNTVLTLDLGPWTLDLGLPSFHSAALRVAESRS